MITLVQLHTNVLIQTKVIINNYYHSKTTLPPFPKNKKQLMMRFAIVTFNLELCCNITGRLGSRPNASLINEPVHFLHICKSLQKSYSEDTGKKKSTWTSYYHLYYNRYFFVLWPTSTTAAVTTTCYYLIIILIVVNIYIIVVVCNCFFLSRNWL